MSIKINLPNELSHQSGDTNKDHSFPSIECWCSFLRIILQNRESRIRRTIKSENLQAKVMARISKTDMIIVVQ